MTLLWQAKSLKDFTRLELVRPEQAQDLGNGTFRAEVRFGDQVPGMTEQRSLWDVSQLAFREGDECALAFGCMLPADWIGAYPKNDELQRWPDVKMHGGSFAEFHHAPNDGNWNTLKPGSAPFYFGANDTNWRAYLLDANPAGGNFGGLRPEATWELKPIARGQWTDFVIHALWSVDPAKGWIEIFADGQPVVPRFRAATLYPATFVYPQIGIYRRNFIGDPSLTWIADAKPGVTYPPQFTPKMGGRVFPDPGGYPQSVQFRNLRIGTTKEDVMATATPVAPATATVNPTKAKAGLDQLIAQRGQLEALLLDMDADAAAVATLGGSLTKRRAAVQKILNDTVSILNQGPWT